MRSYVKIVLCVLFLIVFFYLSIEVYAESMNEKDLPQIVRWEGGYGYDKEGTMILGSWAYDTVNNAGKYVLFGAEGSVLQKADNWAEKDNISENFSLTEQETATIALRADVSPSFSGEISVVLVEKNGLKKSYTLNQDNMLNIPVCSGEYEIESVEAFDDKYVYGVEYPLDRHFIQEKELFLLKIKVTEQIQGTVSVQEKGEKKGSSIELNRETESKQDDRQEDEAMLSENGIKKYMFFMLCCIAAIGLTGYLLLRNKRNKYN